MTWPLNQVRGFLMKFLCRSQQISFLVKPVEVETPKVPSQAAPKPENITVNATVEKVEKESEVVQTNVDNDTNVVKNETAKASVEEKVETVKKQVDNVQVATTEEPPVIEELDSFEKIKVAVADFNRAMWGGDDDDEEDEEEDDKDDNDDDEDDDDDDEDEDDNKHFWEWR